MRRIREAAQHADAEWALKPRDIDEERHFKPKAYILRGLIKGESVISIRMSAPLPEGAEFEIQARCAKDAELHLCTKVVVKGKLVAVFFPDP
jgi:hypothetical protein